MSLDEGMKALKFDARMIEYNLANGIITKEEYEAHLKSLPDDAVKAVPLRIEEEGSDSPASHH